jgi:hypothetical protein
MERAVNITDSTNAISQTEQAMPNDETRRVLKVFRVAVTAFENAVDKSATADEVKKRCPLFAFSKSTRV